MADEFWVSGCFPAFFKPSEGLDSLAFGFFLLALSDAFAGIVCASGPVAWVGDFAVDQVWRIECFVYGDLIDCVSLRGALSVAGCVVEWSEAEMTVGCWGGAVL